VVDEVLLEETLQAHLTQLLLVDLVEVEQLTLTLLLAQLELPTKDALEEPLQV
jgi:hypothetical protein